MYTYLLAIAIASLLIRTSFYLVLFGACSISCDSEINSLCNRLQTALHKAAWYGYETICRILVEQGASLSKTDYQVSSKYLVASFPGPHHFRLYMYELSQG